MDYLGYIITVLYYIEKFRYMLFSTTGPIVNIYQINDGDLLWYTWKYYLGYEIDDKDYYYVSIFTRDKTVRFSIYDSIYNIRKIVLPSKKYHPRRVNYMLSRHGKPINFDLDIIDNYLVNSRMISDNFDTKMSNIVQMLGVDCDSIHIVESDYSITKKMAYETDINDLYVN